MITVDPHRNFYRQLVAASHQNPQFGAGTAYLRTAGRPVYLSDFGTHMIRSGSIVGVGLCVNCTLYDTDATVAINVEKNGTVVFSTSVLVTGTGKFVSTDTQPVGVDTFEEGDLIQISYDKGGVAGTRCKPLGVGELEFSKSEVIGMTEPRPPEGALLLENPADGF